MKSFRPLLNILIMTISLCASPWATATILELKPGAEGKDAQIGDGTVAGSNFGSHTDLVINWGGNFRSVGLIEFDLGAIIGSATINSATLQLYHTTNANNGSTYDIFQVTSAWSEDTVNFNTAPTINPTAASSLTINDSLTGLYREWDITSLVSDWVSGAATNYGMWIEEIPVSGSASAYFASSDAGENFRPILTLDYTPSIPEPETMFLLGLGALAFRLTRKQA